MKSSLLRSFIAIDIPAHTRELIADCVLNFQRSIPGSLVRWVSINNIHLTLKFLGDVSLVDIKRLTDLLVAKPLQVKPFELSFENIGAYPSMLRPRILWVGVNAPPALLSLYKHIENVVACLGFPVEERSFSPHLTIGRVIQHASAIDLAKLRAVLESARMGVFGTTYVESLKLYQSDLRSSGPIYTPLFTLPLKP